MMRAAGPADMITTRSDSAIASSRSWVTNITALRSALHRSSKQIAHDLARLRVERAERLVHQEDFRIANEDLRKTDALALPAREHMRIARPERSQTHALEPILRTFARNR